MKTSARVFTVSSFDFFSFSKLEFRVEFAYFRVESRANNKSSPSDLRDTPELLHGQLKKLLISLQEHFSFNPDLRQLKVSLYSPAISRHRETLREAGDAE